MIPQLFLTAKIHRPHTSVPSPFGFPHDTEVALTPQTPPFHAS